MRAQQKKIKIRLPNGQVIKRVGYAEPLGNFVMVRIRYQNEDYYIGEGTEYLRGQPEVWELDSTSTRDFKERFDEPQGGWVY